MTDLETHRPHFVPTGRPVRRFVVAEVALAVLFGSLWWSGLVAPRLSQGNKSSGSYDTVTGAATMTFRLHNDALAAIDVSGVTLDDGRLTVTSARANGRILTTGGQRLSGGGAATMTVEFACRPLEGGVRPPAPVTDWIKIEITVRTAAGLTRSRAAGTFVRPSGCLG